LAPSRPLTRDIGLVRLGFLGAGRFAAGTLGNGYWILLDFLGFSRPNRDFSMGYAGFSREEFSRAFFADRESGANGDATVEVMRIRRIIHAASLPRFLVFVNRLLSSTGQFRHTIQTIW
jgi:hypothetical protein